MSAMRCTMCVEKRRSQEVLYIIEALELAQIPNSLVSAFAQGGKKDRSIEILNLPVAITDFILFIADLILIHVSQQI